MKHLHRFTALLCAVTLSASLSLPTLAAETLYHIKGVASSKPTTTNGGGVLRPRTPDTSKPASTPATPDSITVDSKGADHTTQNIGSQLLTAQIRAAAPAYYGAKKSIEAAAPDAIKIPTPPLTPQQLAEKYQISIIDKNGYLTGPHGNAAVTLIDEGLAAYSAAFVLTLVEKFREQGIFFAINIHYPDSGEQFKGATESNSDTLCINLSIPYGDNPGGISTGTVAHEFGHAVFMYLEKCIGQNALYKTWLSLNGPYQYGSKAAGRAHAFISAYGARYYYEDPATIFEAFSEAPEQVGEQLRDSDYDLLYKKARYLEQMIEKWIGTPGTIFKNVWAAMQKP